VVGYSRFDHGATALLLGVVMGISIVAGDFGLKFDVTALEATVSACIGLFCGTRSAENH